MAWHERDLGAFGRVHERLPEHYPSSFGLGALFSASERRPPLRASGPAGEPRGLLSIIGPDDRERRTDTELPPLSMICSITATDGDAVSHGTGWLVSPQVVITAAHVLRDAAQNFAAMTAVIRAGCEVGKEPFGVFPVQDTDWKFAPGYDGRGPASADFAAIRLASASNPSLGFFGVGAFSDAALADRLVTIDGYPQWVGDRANVISGDEQYMRMYLHRDRILSLLPGQIFYDVDTFRGQSGAPVVVMPREGDPFSGPVVVGIHTRGQDPNQTEILRTNNSATQVTAAVMNFIRDFVSGSASIVVLSIAIIMSLAFKAIEREAPAQEPFSTGIVPAALLLPLVGLREGNTLGAFLIGVASVGGMDASLQAPRKTLPQ